MFWGKCGVEPALEQSNMLSSELAQPVIGGGTEDSLSCKGGVPVSRSQSLCSDVKADESEASSGHIPFPGQLLRNSPHSNAPPPNYFSGWDDRVELLEDLGLLSSDRLETVFRFLLGWLSFLDSLDL